MIYYDLGASQEDCICVWVIFVCHFSLLQLSSVQTHTQILTHSVTSLHYIIQWGPLFLGYIKWLLYLVFFVYIYISDTFLIVIFMDICKLSRVSFDCGMNEQTRK